MNEDLREMIMTDADCRELLFSLEVSGLAEKILYDRDVCDLNGIDYAEPGMEGDLIARLLAYDVLYQGLALRPEAEKRAKFHDLFNPSVLDKRPFEVGYGHRDKKGGIRVWRFTL